MNCSVTQCKIDLQSVPELVWVSKLGRAFWFGLQAKHPKQRPKATAALQHTWLPRSPCPLAADEEYCAARNDRWGARLDAFTILAAVV